MEDLFMANNNIEKQLKEISERLEQGVKEIFTSERYTEYLNTMSKFHNYSFNNTLLITMQKPEATLVAGYQAWQKKFNRHVKRGEKGIQIIAPTPVREKQEIEKIDPDTQEPQRENRLLTWMYRNLLEVYSFMTRLCKHYRIFPQCQSV